MTVLLYVLTAYVSLGSVPACDLVITGRYVLVTHLLVTSSSPLVLSWLRVMAHYAAARGWGVRVMHNHW
jgi:hypothetical protein